MDSNHNFVFQMDSVDTDNVFHADVEQELNEAENGDEISYILMI